MEEQLKKRTKKIGLDAIMLIDDLPNNPSAWVIGKQIVRSATWVGANYRSAWRAKSKADFINKLKIVEQETDETHFWLEVLEESGLLMNDKTTMLGKEVNGILAIIMASIKTLRGSLKFNPK